ncbi:hypothetical protein [[Kitasatospora] papulosa]|uniref:hypothetical protein n=1 Tax=[Kitasatospora] papulosa TaxID=1464011 RepID=UPI003643F19F
MSEPNDTLATLLIFAAFLHILTLLGMTLHTALAADQPDNDPAQQRPLTALLLGRSPVQRTGRSTFISRLLAVAGLLLTATSVLSFVAEAAPAWTVILTVLAATELASAFAWHKPAGENTTNAADKPDQDSEHATDSDNEEVTKTKDSGAS